MLHRGTQPTAPSRQVHWYLQLLWKDSPLRYTVPPKTQGAPSLAEGNKGRGDARVRSSVAAGESGMRGEQGSGGQGSQHPRRRRGRGVRVRAAALTGAHADLAVGRRAEVAEEALVRVAGVALGAQLAQLLGTHAAAAAAVQHEADARRAAGRRRGRTLARAAALLAGGGLRGGGGGQRAHAARRPGPCPALAARPPPGAGHRGALGLPGHRGRTGARRRSGRGPGRRRTWWALRAGRAAGGERG